jgi:hypothetical protein
MRFGSGWGVLAYRRIPFFAALWTMCGSRSFFLLPLILPLPHLRRRLRVCACIRLDMFSLSLSLSLLPLDVSVCLSIFSARLPSNVPAKN